MEDIGIKIRENGWQQGRLVPAAQLVEYLPKWPEDERMLQRWDYDYLTYREELAN